MKRRSIRPKQVTCLLRRRVGRDLSVETMNRVCMVVRKLKGNVCTSSDGIIFLRCMGFGHANSMRYLVGST